MCVSTKPGMSRLSVWPTTGMSVGRLDNSSRAGPTAATRPSRVTSRPSSRYSKLPASSCMPGSERKCRTAPRCAHCREVSSVGSAMVDPSQHCCSLLLCDAGNVAQWHGARDDLLTHLLRVRQDALGRIERQPVGGGGEP